MTPLEVGVLKYVFPGRFQLLAGTLPISATQLANSVRALGTSFPLPEVWCMGSRPACELLSLSLPSRRAPTAPLATPSLGELPSCEGPPTRPGLSHPHPTRSFPCQAPAPAPDLHPCWPWPIPGPSPGSCPIAPGWGCYSVHRLPCFWLGQWDGHWPPGPALTDPMRSPYSPPGSLTDIVPN